MEYIFETKGTCSRTIRMELDGDMVKSVEFVGGCAGNQAGISKLVENMPAAQVVELLKGTVCGMRSTSCPDQLALALEKAIGQQTLLEEEKREEAEKSEEAIEMCEDDDIRIASSHPSREVKQQENEVDVEASFEELKREKSNGNYQKARSLGAMAAGEVYADHGGSYFGIDESESPQTREQRQMLSAFSAVVGFDQYVPNTHCARAALSTFYDTLKKDAPQIYDAVERSFAFSFYFLEYHRGKDVAHAIGSTFAMLCGKVGDAVYVQLGTALYLHFLDVIRDMAEKAEFIV